MAWWDERKRTAVGSRRYVAYPPRVTLAEFMRGSVDIEKQEEIATRHGHNRPHQQQLQTTIITYLKVCRVRRRDMGNCYMQQNPNFRVRMLQKTFARIVSRDDLMP